MLSDSFITIIIFSVIMNEYISPSMIVKQFGDVLHIAEDKFKAAKEHEKD